MLVISSIIVILLRFGMEIVVFLVLLVCKFVKFKSERVYKYLSSEGVSGIIKE